MAAGLTEVEIQAAHPKLEAEDFRACSSLAASRLKPLDHAPPNPSDQTSEAWLRSRQSQWLAEQEFLKQLWERRAGVNG